MNVIDTDDDALHLQYVLSTAFLSGLPTSRPLWQRGLHTLITLSEHLNGEELADLVMRSTLYHDLALQYPRNRTYVKNVLRWLEDVWDEHQWTGKERLLLRKRDDASCTAEETLEIGYKSYPTEKEGSFITLLESFEGISRGTTGLSSWGAAQVLASWFTGISEDIGGKRIVELGAGTGYTAVAILSSGALEEGPAIYTATDYHPHVLSILHHNLSLLHIPNEKSSDQLLKFCSEMNAKMDAEELPPGEFKFWKAHPGFTRGKTRINVQQLDWRNPNPDLPSCDILLAADVVYAAHLFPDLVRIIRKFLSPSHRHVDVPLGEEVSDNMSNLKLRNGWNVQTKRQNVKANENSISRAWSCDVQPSEANGITNPDSIPLPTSSDPEVYPFSTPKAFVACTRRNQETMTEFLTEVTNQGLSYKTIFQTTLDREGSFFAYDESYKPVKIFEIVL